MGSRTLNASSQNEGQGSADVMIPYGWVIKTYKHMNVSPTDFTETDDIFNGMSDGPVLVGRAGGPRDITYGNYDRIQIIPANSFADFSKEADESYNWYGSSQAIFLFPIEESKKDRLFVWEEDENGTGRILIRNQDAVKKPEGFFAASFCYISDEAHEYAASYGELLKTCRDRILELAAAFNSQLNASESDSAIHGPVRAEVFGSFSSAELVILWSSKQYTDILHLTDCIRDFRFSPPSKTGDVPASAMFSMFRTTYTMISFPDVVKGVKHADPTLADILGDAHVQFVLQNGSDENSYLELHKYLLQCLKNVGKLIGEEFDDQNNDVNLRRCAGEYDLIGNIRSKFLPRLFSNPQNWKQDEDDSWELNPKDPDMFFCSVHHPGFNSFVLYTFTRLSYRESDLPSFARLSGSESGKVPADQPGPDGPQTGRSNSASDTWSETVKRLKCRTWGDKGKDGDKHAGWRSSLIRRIEYERKPAFQKLIQAIHKSIPATSNLVEELKQLFSDYVQCCSSSADYLWIDDYDELFHQVMEHISRLINSIGEEDGNSTKVNEKDEWKNARSSLEDISLLIQALHQQTSHISASNKLFFKEQDTHFGYTAQHDLVIHAYYDIIKYLIWDIYTYTDPVIQSRLYPLVNFCPENRVSSEIFTEESALSFLTDNQNGSGGILRPRIMVIHIPLDGMDNLMHYLPMLVHEVYHYAAPKSRRRRNGLLVNIVVYQVLRYAFFMVFRDMLSFFSGEQEELHTRDNADLERWWRETVDSVVYEVITEHEQAIYSGFQSTFFSSETGAKCDPDFVEQAQILRSWLILWLRNWIHDENFRKTGKSGKVELPQDDNPSFDNFSRLFPLVFEKLKQALQRPLGTSGDHSGGVEEADFAKRYQYLSSALYQRISETLDKKDPSLYQVIAKKTSDYVDKNIGLEKLLENLDELFPDLAMVMHTNMSAAGYMLQIALDMDKQLYRGDDYYMNQIRFGAVLYWIFCRDAGTEEKDWIILEKALDEFEQLYLASYGMVGDLKEGEERNQKRAKRWREVFQNIYLSYLRDGGFESFGHIRVWIKKLLEQMTESLMPGQYPEEYRRLHRERFVDSYARYLSVLKEENIGKRQEMLLSLSIQTILNFQRRIFIRQINEEFRNKAATGTEHAKPLQGGDEVKPGKASIPHPKTIRLSEAYSSRLTSASDYFSAIQYHLSHLYQFREIERVPSATGMWYRGIMHAEYPVLPSGFVHFTEDAGRLRKQFPVVGRPYYYAQAQLHNYEAFRYSVEGAGAGIDPSRYYSTINYIALMQHYSQHTNLLDWSEDAFASTYFALEDEININDKYDHEKKDKERNLPNRDADAALYILDPVRFNRACDEIEQECFFDADIRKPLRKEMLQTTIPNLSIGENQKAFHEYVNPYQKKPDGEDVLCLHGKWNQEALKKGVTLKDLSEYLPSVKQHLHIHLPRAIYTAKLNERIRAQSGLFVAFSMNSLPVIREGQVISTGRPGPELFTYQALETIQEYYLTRSFRYPFLMKIIIPASLREEMGKTFYHFGISKERVYPELQNYRNR